MRRDLLRFLFLFSFFSYFLLSAQDFEIKSLRIYSSYDQTSFPLIDLSDSTRSTITIEFDLDGQYIPNLNIIFKFCDSNWQPYSNIFLSNPGYNTEYNLWLERIPLRVQGACYHYQGIFPNNNVTFPFSGKWKFFVVDSQNRDKIYTEGSFYVVYPEIRLNVDLTKERAEDSIPELAVLGRTISLRTSVNLPDSLFPIYLKSVEIIENKKILYPIIIDRNKNLRNRYYEWNGSKKFTFIAKDLKPGNEYRMTDFSDVNRFNQPNINAQYDGVEISNLFKKGYRDHNGGSILIDYRDQYAEYMNVNFRLRPPENITSPIFVVGSFTNWQVFPDYEMYDDNGLLNLQIELKRGEYDYQYVTGLLINEKVTNIDWQILEGNFWETENEYNIFLYYESTEKGGYDKIIGYKKINTGEL